MRKEHTAPAEQKAEVAEWTEKMKDFCRKLAVKDLEFLPGLEKEELEQVLKMQGLRRYLLTNSLERGYQLFYIPKAIQKGIRESIKSRPEEEYPEARQMKRKFILHIGPTNSGKTHDALERLKDCSHGAYFGPLRLLALEVYDKCNMEDVYKRQQFIWSMANMGSSGYLIQVGGLGSQVNSGGFLYLLLLNPAVAFYQIIRSQTENQDNIASVIQWFGNRPSNLVLDNWILVSHVLWVAASVLLLAAAVKRLSPRGRRWRGK